MREQIQQTLREKGIAPSWLAKKIHCHTTNIYKIFQKQHLDNKLLLDISKALDTDFFAYFSDILNKKKQSKSE